MISISKSKFVVLGFVMVALLLIPVNDAFAFSITLFDDDGNIVDHEKYTISGYEDDRLYYHSMQKDGVSQSTGSNRSHDGWMSPYPLPDNNVPGSYTWTWFSDNARTNQIAQVSWVRDIPADPTPVTQLTINSLEIYEEGDYTRYHVIGDAPASTNLTFTMTKPDGSNGDYNGSAGTGQPSYNHDGLVSPNSDLVYGTWNLEICTAEHNMCVQESFTIDSIVEDTPANTSLITPSITTSAFLNSTSSTGRTLTVNFGNWTDGIGPYDYPWQYYTIIDPNGMDLGWNFGIGDYDGYYWSMEIPVSWEPGEYTIASLPLFNSGPISDVMGPYSTMITVPALDTPADTTPPVITVPDNITITTSNPDIHTNSTGKYPGAIAWDGTGVSFGDATNIPSPACTGNFSPQGYLNGPVWFPPGGAMISCTASDDAGNTKTGYFMVNVEIADDSTWSGGLVGDGTSHVDVYDYPYDITIQEGGTFTLYNYNPHDIYFDGFDGSSSYFTGQVACDVMSGNLDCLNHVATWNPYSVSQSANSVTFSLPLDEFPAGSTYTTRDESTSNDSFRVSTITVIENTGNVQPSFTSSDASIQITSNKNILDRTFGQHDLAEVTINYQNLNPVANIFIKTPDGIEHNAGGFRTNYVLDPEHSMAWTSNGTSGTYNSSISVPDFMTKTTFAKQFDSFLYIVDDGVTRGELEFQIIGDYPALADHTITTVAESGSSQECVDTGCYTPSTLTVDVGDLINMTNSDPSGMMHTFTSGTMGDELSGVTFDSAYLMADMSYTWTPTSNQDQLYYCMLHPWMVGTIVVGDVDVAEQIPEPEPVGETWGELGSVYHRFDGPYDFLQTQVTSNIIRGDVKAEILLNGEVLREYITATDNNGAFFYSKNITDDPAGIFEFRLLTTTNDLLDRECYSWNGFNNPNNKSVNCNTPLPMPEPIPEPEPVGETWGELGSVYHRYDGPYDFLQTQVTSNIIRGDVIAEILLNGEVLREYTPATDHNGAFFYSKNITDDPAGIFEFRLLTTTNDLLDRECYSWNGFNNPNNKSVNCNTSFPIPEQIAEADTIPPVVEEMTVSTSKEVSLGELLKISIIASHKISVTIEIIDPSGNIVDNTLSCNTTKEFICETFWLVPEEILPGMYTVKVNDGIHSDQITFDVEGESFPIFITGKQNITLDATTSNGAIVNYELPQATIPGSGVDLGITCTPASGSFFPLGTTEVTCSASDWAGNVGTTSFTVTVQPQIAVPVEITTDVTLEIGLSQYKTGGAIFVTGVATPFTENNVSIQVNDPSDNVVSVEQITPKSTGVYTGIIYDNFLWSVTGNYTMSVTYGNSTDSTSFGFEFFEPPPPLEPVFATGITLQTDTSMYAIGDMITIESALTDVGSGYEIGIFVEDPTGELRVIQFLNTDDSGSVSLSLKAQDNWIPGKYFVIASDTLAYDGTCVSENTCVKDFFDLVKPIPEITISPTVTTTESGDTITSYDAGDMAYFETSLLSESTSDVLVTINVVDSDNTTMGVAFFKSIIGKGDSELVLGFKIPEDAADGTAKIYVNTYTDWIDQGGIVIGSELLSEVNIDGVIIEVVEETVVEEVVEETVLPENTIPRLSTVTDITQPASFTTGSVVSYSLPLATSGAITHIPTCTPAPGSMFPIGSTQVTCTATNDFRNTGMTSFMVTINPILQTADQSLSVKVGKDSYNNLEPLFVTGSVGKITDEPINLEVRDTQNNLISIEQVTPKESGVYSTVLTSNELWDIPGEYTIIAKYEGIIALDTFAFELMEVEEVIPEKIPTSLFIDTLDSAYVLGDDVFIGVNLVDAGAGEPILLKIKDSQNDQVSIQSLNTDSDGWVFFTHQLDSSGEPGVYSVTATSDEWSFSNSENFIAVAQIPDITIGDVVSTLQDGTEVDSFESGDMGYFQTPIISESVSDVLITVNIFDVENTPLGLAYFNSKVVDDTFDITLGLQIPQDAAPGLATVYINTYTDWVSEGGVPILEEQVSFIEIVPFSTTSLTVSSGESEPTAEVELVPITGNISVNTESTSYTTGNTIVISGSIQNLAEVEQPVVIIIISPDGNFITIDQVSHDSSGNYSTIVTAGGTMNSSGEYEIRAQYGVNQITSTFDFTRN